MTCPHSYVVKKGLNFCSHRRQEVVCLNRYSYALRETDRQTQRETETETETERESE